MERPEAAQPDNVRRPSVSCSIATENRRSGMVAQMAPEQTYVLVDVPRTRLLPVVAPPDSVLAVLKTAGLQPASVSAQSSSLVRRNDMLQAVLSGFRHS